MWKGLVRTLTAKTKARCGRGVTLRGVNSAVRLQGYGLRKTLHAKGDGLACFMVSVISEYFFRRYYVRRSDFRINTLPTDD